jgi:hypothetical protein
VADWDEDSPQLRANLAEVLQDIVRAAKDREIPTLESARKWQALAMRGLDVPDLRFVGAFRGEPGLENIRARVGANWGVDPADVARDLAAFQETLQMLVAELDKQVPVGREPDADQLAAIIDLSAWAHAEWVRIHPFANGNGRTARLWANSIATRYGLPPFIRLRPRHHDGYGSAGATAMQGDWEPTAAVFRKLLQDFLREV